LSCLQYSRSPGRKVLAYINELVSHPGSRSSSEAADPIDDDTLVVEPDQGNGQSTHSTRTFEEKEALIWVQSYPTSYPSCGPAPT
jgi:hypothetical protein